MDFLALCQRVRQESGIADSGPSNVTGQIGDLKRMVDWVNEAYMRVQSFRDDWEWLWTSSTVSVIAGTAVYSLPATIENLIANTVYLDGKKLSSMSYEDYRERHQTLVSGTPSSFAIRPDGKIALNADPDASGTLSFEAYTKPVYFTQNIDAPLFDERFHMILVWSALLDYALFDEAPELVTKAQVKYQNLLAELSAEIILAPGAIA